MPKTKIIGVPADRVRFIKFLNNANAETLRFACALLQAIKLPRHLEESATLSLVAEYSPRSLNRIARTLVERL